jgi:uncharacterized protein (DUF2147 family)
MATKKAKNTKAKAAKVGITQLVVLTAYSKTFSSGKGGFFGKVIDPATGKRYQIIGAVELAA